MTNYYELKRELEKKDLEVKLDFATKHPDYLYDLEQRKVEDHESQIQHRKEFSEHRKKLDEHMAVDRIQNEIFVNAVARIADAMEKSNLRIDLNPQTKKGRNVMAQELQDRGPVTQKYYGTKLVEAWETKGGKDNLRTEEGYSVKYEDGYMSWSPKVVFEKAYQPLTAMSFGHAIEALKAGQKVCRAGWNGKGMFLFLVPDSQFEVRYPHLLGVIPEGTKVSYWGHIDMKAVDGKIGPWLASQSDMLANDWQVVID